MLSIAILFPGVQDDQSSQYIQNLNLISSLFYSTYINCFQVKKDSIDTTAASILYFLVYFKNTYFKVIKQSFKLETLQKKHQ